MGPLHTFTLIEQINGKKQCSEITQPLGHRTKEAQAAQCSSMCRHHTPAAHSEGEGRDNTEAEVFFGTGKGSQVQSAAVVRRTQLHLRI